MVNRPHARLGGQQPLVHRGLDQQAEPVAAVRPGHGGHRPGTPSPGVPGSRTAWLSAASSPELASAGRRPRTAATRPGRRPLAARTRSASQRAGSIVVLARRVGHGLMTAATCSTGARPAPARASSAASSRRRRLGLGAQPGQPLRAAQVRRPACAARRSARARPPAACANASPGEPGQRRCRPASSARRPAPARRQCASSAGPDAAPPPGRRHGEHHGSRVATFSRSGSSSR